MSDIKILIISVNYSSNSGWRQYPNQRLSIADRMSQLCGVLIRRLRTIEPVTAGE